MSFWCVAPTPHLDCLNNGVQKSHEEPFRKFSQLYEITIKWKKFLLIHFLWLLLFGGARVAYENRKLFLITTGGNFHVSPTTDSLFARVKKKTRCLGKFCCTVCVNVLWLRCFRCPIAHYHQEAAMNFAPFSRAEVFLFTMQITLGN